MTSLSRTGVIASAVASALIGAAVPAAAATFGATELSNDAALLGQFNLVNLGNYAARDATAAVAGRAVVGGTAATAGNRFCNAASCGPTTQPVSGITAQPYGALTVFGSITGPASTRGEMDVRGNLSASTYDTGRAGGVNFGGSSQAGTVFRGTTEIRTLQPALTGTVRAPVPGNTVATAPAVGSLADVFAPFGHANTLANSFANPMKDLSAGLANLPGTPGVKAQALPGNGSALIAGHDFGYGCSGGACVKSYGVVQTTVDQLANLSSFKGVADGGNDATFVIVNGSLADGKMLPSLANNPAGGYGKVLYDFVDASELRFAGAWNASILAPLANVTAQGGRFNGSVVVASMTQTAMLLQGNAFTGDLSGLRTVSFRRVPEPASLALLAMGAVGAAWARRRGKMRSDAARSDAAVSADGEKN